MEKIRDYKDLLNKVSEYKSKIEVRQNPEKFNNGIIEERHILICGGPGCKASRADKIEEKFKEEIPRYMIKHQVRPGLTGWAQVNGYRGDTSIKKRIEHDLYYIENWTMGLDIKILFLTIFKGFVNKNAY